jgi:hypothetical protein
MDSTWKGAIPGEASEVLAYPSMVGERGAGV